MRPPASSAHGRQRHDRHGRAQRVACLVGHVGERKRLAHVRVPAGGGNWLHGSIDEIPPLLKAHCPKRADWVMGAAASAKSRPPASRPGAKSAAGMVPADVERPTFAVLVRARTPRLCTGSADAWRRHFFAPCVGPHAGREAPLTRLQCGAVAQTTSDTTLRAAGAPERATLRLDPEALSLLDAATGVRARCRRPWRAPLTPLCGRNFSGSGSTPRCCAGATAPVYSSSSASGATRRPSRTSTSCRCRQRGCERSYGPQRGHRPRR